MRAQDRSKWRQLVETAMLTDGRATRWWWWWCDKESNYCKLQMADGRHIENRILAICPRFIGRLTRHFVWRSRITFRYRPRDQNTKFWKFNMADGRHFENGFITISQPWIIRFQWNLVCHCRFSFQKRSRDKVSKFCKLKTADGRHIENRFWLYFIDLLSN